MKKDMLTEFGGNWYVGASDDDREEFRKWLGGVLRMQNEVKIEFTKKDGTTRKMKCTLKEEHLPARDKESAERAENINSVSVWDIEKKDWRAFRYDSIKSIRFDLGG